MEDVKPSISSNFDDGDAMEARFGNLCKSVLALDESTTRQAMVLFRETKQILMANISTIGSGSPGEVERYWSAFVLYCIIRLGQSKGRRESGRHGVSLCQILRASKLNIVDFFKEMPQFSLKASYILSGLYGSDWEKRLELKELQVNFVHLSALSRHYRRAYQELFLRGDSSSQPSGILNNTGYISDYHRFGWLLFLALRVHTFSRFRDLVTCTNGLVSILAILILHVPIKFRNFHVADFRLFGKKTEKGVDLLASLCDIYHTSEDELKITLEKTNKLIADILNKKPRPASECKTQNLDFFNTDGLICFEGLLEDDSLQSILLILEKDYDEAINTIGELDERVFCSDDDSVLGTGSLSGGAINISSRKSKLDMITSPAKTIKSPTSFMQSPTSTANGNLSGSSKIVFDTPVSTAMTTAKWLRSIISPLPSKPDGELRRFLSSCDKDMNNDIIRRANLILGAIFPVSSFGERRMPGSFQGASLMDTIWAEQRKLEALKLYYRVLEAMCRAESQKLNGNNLTLLLTNERFHRCMLACSAELVLATHKTVTMMFPAVLERTGITAFDLSKVIESFVRHEETLPRELKRHLNSLEERLLESMAWEKGSSMYNSLIVARPSLSPDISRLGLLAEPMLSLDAIAANYNIPVGGLPPLPLHKRENFSDLNGDAPSPKKQCTEYNRIVLVERASFTSPVKDRTLAANSPKSKLPPLQSTFASTLYSPTRPSPSGGGETCAEISINVFFSKIIKLSAIRIRSLCERLQLSQEAQERVYYLIQQILSQKTSLFFNRHIDQIILCSFYGVAKISHLDLTFKEIIYNYRKQPQCKPQVFRSVFISWPSENFNGKKGQEHVDIITFYNEIFIPSVKPLLVELGSAAVRPNSERPSEVINNIDGPIPGSPQLSRFPNLPDMSPKKVSASHNVYVSPLRTSKMDSLLSPSSKSYYACVGESTHAYQSPSKDLSAINNRLNSRKISGRLNFDMVSDSVVAGSLGPHNSSSDSSAAATVLKNPVKCELPDL
ncbi:retinoblastoma-related protein isoform X2 [Phalaenopsis equestris]|uniref:retinoblastoma-related protein isoform X2 n=1 Tax=Phalaenopsis equestris TaxID=78828 RepID=UPI0009E2E62E|nr:retinoblastoma-related protein isoform X2 [Phalaenopsis equestris]